MRISELDDIKKRTLLGRVVERARVDLNEGRPLTETGSEICAQCESNARWNEAGGYRELAKQCRDYCRRGHKEPS